MKSSYFSVYFFLSLLFVLSGCFDDSSGTIDPELIIASDTKMFKTVFPHDEHTEDYGIDCEECHHETDALKLENPHPEYLEDLWIDCKACHHEVATPQKPQACSNCHHPSLAGSGHERLSARVAIHETCWECHDVGEGQEATEACGLCHPKD
jgi:hypothetical protein